MSQNLSPLHNSAIMFPTTDYLLALTRFRSAPNISVTAEFKRRLIQVAGLSEIEANKAAHKKFRTVKLINKRRPDTTQKLAANARKYNVSSSFNSNYNYKQDYCLMTR